MVNYILIKKIAGLTFVFVFSLISLWYVFFYICEKKNNLTGDQIMKLLQLVDGYYLKYKKYPNSLADIGQFQKIKQEKVLFFVSGAEIEYSMMGDGFQIYYYQAPLGPFHGYDSRKKDWYYEE